MSRPFRHAPPSRQPGWLLRPHVQRSLARRFETRVTVLQAGAGFGKTTALALAAHENQIAPLGIDCWVACEPGDADRTHLAGAILHSLGVESAGHPDPDATRVLEACRSAAPAPVCLVFDDVHLVEPDSTGAELLAVLVRELPANGHLVLAGRTAPPVPLTRLEATDAVTRLTETDLAFSTDEAQIVLAGFGSPIGDAEVQRLAGWPALVRLAGSSGHAEDFVWEEVVDWLSPAQHDVLVSVIAGGETDLEVLNAVCTADDVRPEDLPLVHRRSGDDGVRFAAHDLWHELLGTSDAVRARRVEIVRWLIDHERFHEAVDLCLVEASADTPLPEELFPALRGALVGLNPPPSAQLRRWWQRVEPSVSTGSRSSRPPGPEVILLEALVLRLDDPGGDACRHRLRSAADAFLALDATAAAIGALGALAFAFHVRRDTDGLVATFGELAQLADAGHAEAVPYRTIALASLATALADPASVIEHTSGLLTQRLPRDVRAVALWFHANALSNLGHDSIEPAREVYETGLDLPGLNMVWIGSRWRAGRVAELLDDPMLFGPEAGQKGARNEFLTAVWRCLVAVGVHDLDTANEALATILGSSASETQWQSPGSVLIPHAAVLAEAGEHEGAEALMRDMLGHHPIDGDAHLYYLGSLCLSYWYLPEHRAYFDTRTDLGPQFLRDLALNQAYVAVAEHDDTSTLSTLVLPDDAGALLPALGPTHAVELLGVCRSSGNPQADPLIEQLIELLGERIRTIFRTASEHPNVTIAKAARDALESIPVPPPAAVSIALFGGTELTVGHQPVDHPDWRRERVRALLTYLATHPDTTREAAIAALWPDATVESGRRNLRSTLNVLNRVLEPNRQGGDAPWFVRSSGQRLRLFTSDDLSVDVIDFERLVDDAQRLEADGMPSLAIEPLRSAVAMYSGDLLPDSYDDWVLFARDRLRTRYVAAAIRCAELLIAQGNDQEAITVLTPALAVEPWSEPAHRALVTAHLAAGDVAAARRAMATCHAVLAEVGGPTEQLTSMLERRLTQTD